MQTLSLINLFLAITLAGTLAITIARLARAIHLNIQAGCRYRTQLTQELGRLPLSKMLGVKGISTRYYLHYQYGYKIEQQLQHCKACASQKICRRDLQQGKLGEIPVYCPNHRTLASLAA
ncbi:MAG: hypothetical protein HOE99_10765 [Acidiferrobacteraceae bacterium]|jgi:hypothetical protein|nr:hypothetical protein [Acidiferrobacteraceae bacterium]MBT4393640.1 hypothetical protein [Acidiferrobacteraceae bacterium]